MLSCLWTTTQTWMWWQLLIGGESTSTLAMPKERLVYPSREKDTFSVVLLEVGGGSLSWIEGLMMAGVMCCTDRKVSWGQFWFWALKFDLTSSSVRQKVNTSFIQEKNFVVRIRNRLPFVSPPVEIKTTWHPPHRLYQYSAELLYFKSNEITKSVPKCLPNAHLHFYYVSSVCCCRSWCWTQTLRSWWLPSEWPLAPATPLPSNQLNLHARAGENQQELINSGYSPSGVLLSVRSFPRSLILPAFVLLSCFLCSCFLINTADRIIRVYDGREILTCGRDGEPEPMQKLQDLVNRYVSTGLQQSCCWSGIFLCQKLQW